jgi:hypothetical protein
MNKFELGQKQESIATDKYNKIFTVANELYFLATVKMSNKTAIALQDDALALCGHPHKAMSNREWSPEAVEFLTLFI